MLLDEGQVAVTELVMRCRAVAARYQQALDLAPDAAMRSKLDSLANQRREQADALDRLLRDAGVMPHDSEAEAETLREMLTYLRANFGGAPDALSQQVLSQGEASLWEAIEAARAQSLSAAFKRQITELSRSVEAERQASAAS